MTEQTIDVTGLPEGWKAVAYRVPTNGETCWHQNFGIYTATVSLTQCFIVEKIKPRRIVLEETNEERRICYGEWYESQEGKLMRWPYGGKTDGKHRVWREVKETDIPLTNEDVNVKIGVSQRDGAEPKLSLSVDECKEAMRKLETFNVTDLSVKICGFLKENS